MSALPVEPPSPPKASEQVPGTASAPTSALAYIRPDNTHNMPAEELRNLPVECWDPIANRRFVILARRPILTDDSMCGFTARWLDEDRVQNIRLRARRLVQVIGLWDWGPDSHPDLWRKVADPDGWADSDERKNRRFGVQR